MTLRDLYETAIEIGRLLDPRPEEAIEQQLKDRRREYEALRDWQKPYFDRERWRNPYGDVRVISGPEDVEVRSILVGININMEEFLLADALRRNGTRVDAIVAHHTAGVGRVSRGMYDVLNLNIDLMEAEGVPRTDAERCIGAQMHDGWLWQEDWNRMGRDMATLLGFPLIQIHTPVDLCARKGIKALFAEAQPRTLEDVLSTLLTIPEMRSAAEIGAEPRLYNGDLERPAGKIMVKNAGGRLLPPDAYPLLGAAGVNTVTQIGCGPAHAQQAATAGVAIVRMAPPTTTAIISSSTRWSAATVRWRSSPATTLSGYSGTSGTYGQHKGKSE